MAAIAIFATIAGCAGLAAPPVTPGMDEQAVVARLGLPSQRHRAGPETFLEYNAYPWGQHKHMARIGADGKLISYEQVLDPRHFGSIAIGTATRQDVLRTIGTPAETGYFPRLGLETWSYPYKESGTWDSMMHVYFDAAGIVRRMESGPDPHRDPERRFRLLR